MPRRRQRIKKKVELPVDTRSIVIVSILFGILVLLVVIAKSLLSATENPFTLSIAKENGDVDLVMADFSNGYVAKVVIPKDTEVHLAMQRGTLRANSIWKLVKSENLPGQFVADTVMRTFHIPVDYWASERAMNKLTSIESNIPLVTRLRLMVALRDKNIDEIDLSKTSYLTETKLIDGEEGYKINGTLPLTVSSLSADENIASFLTAVLIINKTGKPNYLLSDAAGVLEVLGGKVAPILESSESNDTCSVQAVNKKERERVAKIFNCTEVSGIPESFDIQITFGKKFLERF